MSYAKDFRLIKQCQIFCADIIDIEGNADKRYKFSICQDMRHMAENVVHLVRRANDLPAGTGKRIEMQDEIIGILEDIKDLIWVSGKLLAIGVKREAYIESSLEKLQGMIRNWSEVDQKKHVEFCLKQYKNKAWEYQNSKDVYKTVSEYNKLHPTEKNQTALEESMARCRNAQAAYKEAKAEYDASVAKLRETQSKFNKDDSVLAEVLKEIKNAKD